MFMISTPHCFIYKTIGNKVCVTGDFCQLTSREINTNMNSFSHICICVRIPFHISIQLILSHLPHKKRKDTFRKKNI